MRRRALAGGPNDSGWGCPSIWRVRPGWVGGWRDSRERTALTDTSTRRSAWLWEGGGRRAEEESGERPTPISAVSLVLEEYAESELEDAAVAAAVAVADDEEEVEEDVAFAAVVGSSRPAVAALRLTSNASDVSTIDAAAPVNAPMETWLSWIRSAWICSTNACCSLVFRSLNFRFWDSREEETRDFNTCTREDHCFVEVRASLHSRSQGVRSALAALSDMRYCC